MKSMVMIMAAGAILAAAAAQAQSGADVLKAKGCLNCHDVEKKKIGPPYRDVAAKYKDNKSAEGDLVAKLKEGKGHPKVQASDAELQAAVRHVLATK
jgi:cytochrome c